MYQKNLLRKYYSNLRKKKYFEVDQRFFLPFINHIKKNLKNKKFNLAIYYPANFEVDVIRQVLLVNKFGMLEPIKSKPKIPDIILVPVLSFDRRKYRLGYGKGFYDRYLNKYLKKFKNILTVGVAFSFQKHHKLPIDKNDVKLNYILTEKGIH